MKKITIEELYVSLYYFKPITPELQEAIQQMLDNELAKQQADPVIEQKRLLCLAMYERVSVNMEKAYEYALKAKSFLLSNTVLPDSLLHLQTLLVYIEIQSYYIQNNTELIELLNECFLLSEKHNYYEFRSIITSTIDCYLYEHKIEDTYNLLNTIQKISIPKIANDITYCYHYGMARSLTILRKHQEAIEHHLKCLDFTIHKDDIYRLICWNFEHLGDFEKAYHYAVLAQKVAKENNNEIKFYDALYETIRYHFNLKKDITEGFLKSVYETINYFQRNGQSGKYPIAILYQGLGIFYRDNHQNHKAIEYFTNAVQLIEDNPVYRMDTLTMKSDILKSEMLERGCSSDTILLFDTLLEDLKEHFKNVVNRNQERHFAEFKTKEKDLEIQQLKALDEFKKRFFTNITHDIRTPVSLILAPLESSIAHTTDALLKYNLQLAYSNAQKLEYFLEQLLDLNKIEEGLLQPKYVYGDIIQFCNSIVQSFQTERIINLTSNIRPTMLRCFFAVDGLGKILQNLLANAIKFSEQHTSILVKINYKNDQLVLTVKDQGIGIATKNLDKIFDRFYQVENADTKPYQGSGIGLSIVKEYVTLLGGQIDVKSKLNKGTAFTIVLPYKSTLDSNESYDNTYVQPIPKAAEDIVYPNQKVVSTTDKADTILLVEDNEELRTFLKVQLESSYRILEASNGKEAWQKAQKLSPSLVVSDIMMPEMDGISLCMMIKKDKNTNHIPVLLLSAKTSTSSEVMGYGAMADAYIKKPFNIESLIASIQAIINNRALVQQKVMNAIRNDLIEQLAIDTNDGFINQLHATIEKHIYNPDMNVEMLANEMGTSKSTLLRKLKHYTGKRTVDVIMEIKLNTAKLLLEKKESTVKNIAYKLGFVNLNHFHKAYKKKFGITPASTV